MKSVIIEPHYLPSLEYFCAIGNYEGIILEKHEHYVKQSYRNRCYINTAHGPQMLVVPLTQKHGKVSLKDVRIDNRARWQNNQWRTLQSAYAKAPFFEHYAGELNTLIYTDTDFLFDLCLSSLSFCLRNLGMKKEIISTQSYEKQPPEGVRDLRSQIVSKVPFVERPFYTPKPYYQVFGNVFASNLSLVDLLFCEGPRALTLLQASGREELNK